MTNSRDKGARGEREWAAKLSEHGFPARRGQQFHGGEDSPDVLCEALPAIHFEVKRTEALRIYDALEQAKADAGERLPVVAHRRNASPWLVVMAAEDFLRLVRESSYADEWYLCRAGERPVPCDPPTKVAPGALPRR